MLGTLNLARSKLRVVRILRTIISILYLRPRQLTYRRIQSLPCGRLRL